MSIPPRTSVIRIANQPYTTEPMNLSGLNKKPSTGKAAKKVYPTLPDPEGDVAKSVRILADTKAKLDQLKGTYATHEAELKSLAKQFAFSRREAPGTVKAFADNGATVSLSMQNRYYGIDSTSEDSNGNAVENPRVSSLKKVMGPRFDDCMESEVSVTIDINKFAPEERQEVIDQLVAIAQMYDAGEAIAATEKVRPKDSFHLDRTEKFTEAENHEIDKHLPMVCMLRAKGVSS